MSDTIQYLAQGGIMMIPLLFCSILGLTIAIERFINLRRKKVLIPEIITVVESIGQSEDVALAVNICKKNSGPLANIILTALNNQNLPSDDIKELINDQGRQEVRILERGLPILESIAGVAPLLGLLGTVLGMIKVFEVISTHGSGQTNLLAGGISEALITTVAGLMIGIPALVAFQYFMHRADNFILDIEKYTTTLLQKLKLMNLQNVVTPLAARRK